MKCSTHLLTLLASLSFTGLAYAEPSADESAVAVTEDATKQFVNKVNAATGLEFFGYARGGFYTAPSAAPKGGYTLGGDLQKFRLGNEGDNNLEFGMGKKFDLGGGLHWGVYYMPQVYNGDYRTAQAYTTISGFSFAPEVTFWAGQRYRRLADIHIVDNFLMQDGDNYGAGVDGIKLGNMGKLNIALHSSDSTENKAGNPNNAKRLNFQWTDIPSNTNGKLTLTAGFINGNFVMGSQGAAVGLMHKQTDFMVRGLNNTFFLQASSGHASINGKFYNLDNSVTQSSVLVPGGGILPDVSLPVVQTTVYAPQPGAKQRRIADAIDFQIGRWGGQALIGYQTLEPDNGGRARDLSVGGRVSYGISRNIKLLGELGSTRRSVDGQPNQALNKGTLAVALSPDTNFWTRPEFRIYATRASWNDAAMRANAGSFGSNGRRNATLFGIQMEAWW